MVVEPKYPASLHFEVRATDPVYTDVLGPVAVTAQQGAFRFDIYLTVAQARVLHGQLADVIVAVEGEPYDRVLAETGSTHEANAAVALLGVTEALR